MINDKGEILDFVITQADVDHKQPLKGREHTQTLI